MSSFVYITNSARVKEFFGTIQGAGVPSKVTTKYIESLGFKTKNDRPLLTIVKALGFVTSSGEPTKKWQLYRNKKHAPAVMAQAIKEYYAELYKTYADAHLKDNEALHNFFSTQTTVGATTLRFMIATFRTLAGLADFQAQPTPAPADATPPAGDIPLQVDTTELLQLLSKKQGKAGLTVNINIQLTLPEGATPETFDAFFNAMKKHLLE